MFSSFVVPVVDAMGEVVVSASGGGGGMVPFEDREVKAAAPASASVEDEIVVESEEREKNDSSAGDGGGDGGGGGGGGVVAGVVKWERFLPRVVLRVLLVEADDSTRQIIAALLRKCSYRVAAVPDGLKAWEILKGRPRNVDLILTEVDLPAISGYALLTLIMEHDICKNIPVIMMSTQDSISTVYKCMLRGAADYLVKPIRRNELKNLWQHVWRRHSSLASGHARQEDIVALQKVEATAENNDASNHSSGYVACVERDKELIEKGSDAQSSCTKPDMETDFVEIEQKHDLSQAEWGKPGGYDMKTMVPEENIQSTQKVSFLQEGLATLGAVRYSQLVESKDVKPKLDKRDTTIDTEVCGDNEATINSYREANNLVGAFDNYPCGSFNDFAREVCTRQLDLPPELDLSLKRSDLSGFRKHSIEERQTLKHSDASAFSRYVNKSSHTLRSGLASTSNEAKENGSNPEKNNSQTANFNKSDAPGSGQSTPESITSLATGQSSQSEFFLPSPNQKAFPAPIPVKGVRFDNASTEYGSMYPQVFGAQSVPSIVPSPRSARQKETFFSADSFHKPNNENVSFEHLNDPLDHNASNSSNQGTHRKDPKDDSVEDHVHISPSTDRSEKSSFCNGTLTHRNSIDCGSICGSNNIVNQAPVVRSDGDSKSANGFVVQDGNVQRSIQREAALAKFRLKRKDRCYEKKVRYESRKKLAEQRPRVKGQFVRQAQTDSAPGETDN